MSILPLPTWGYVYSRCPVFWETMSGLWGSSIYLKNMFSSHMQGYQPHMFHVHSFILLLEPALLSTNSPCSGDPSTVSLEYFKWLVAGGPLGLTLEAIGIAFHTPHWPWVPGSAFVEKSSCWASGWVR